MSGTRALTLRLRGHEPDPLTRAAYLRLFSWDDDPPWDQEWNGFLMRSTKSFRIYNYLDRYCMGTIDGFSILLAGQRGAGKTTLVKLLIQNAFLRSDGLIPLPIFLHGPTMIDPRASEAPKSDGKGADGGVDVGKPVSVAINIGGGGVPAPPATTVVADDDGGDTFKSARESKANALPKMIAAMHGSLTDTICEAWRNAAERSLHRQRHPGELLEIAAHLDRMLELAPVVEPLRKIWRRGGFLRNGVAQYLRSPQTIANARKSRPRPIGEVPRIAGRKQDQGVREIVALVASSDAYRGVLGQNKDTFSSTRSAREERQGGMPSGKSGDGKPEAGKSETGGGKSDQEKKETAAKVGPPAIGAAAAALTLPIGDHASILLSALIGIVTWSVSWFVWNYSVSRTSSKSLTRESSFTVDWSEVRVLERRFPILLQRIKDAGFAPIFVLDELDKLDDIQIRKLRDFLTLTKHIVADHAAFFFLVNRDYYEELERLDRGLPPAVPGPAVPGPNMSQPRNPGPTRNPVERTFYTERVFVVYEPGDYRAHARRLSELDGGGATDRDRFEARVAIEAWATSLVYRSHLLMFDFRRRFFALFDIDGTLRADLPFNPLTSPAELKSITLQLGIEAMAARPAIRARIDENPYYARLIYDTFYYLDTLEHDPNAAIEINSEMLDTYFAELSGTESPRSPSDFLGENTLFEFLSDYVTLLSDPARLREEILAPLRGSTSEDAPFRRALAEAIDVNAPLIRIGPNA